MSRFASNPLPPSLAGVSKLPPTLQPGAIFQAAPPRDRRLSVLVTLHVYAGLLLLWICVHPGKGAAESFRETPRQTVTLHFEEPSVAAPSSLMPSIQSSAARAEPDASSFPLTPSLTVPELITPMADVSRAFQELPLLQPVPQDPGQPVAAGGVAHGVDSGRSNGKGLSKGSGRTMFRAVPGLNPGLDLNDLEVIHEEIPSYPLLAEWGKIQGDVVVRVTIDEKGVPIRTELQEGPQALQSETMRAVKLWRFGRGIFRGQKVNATFDMTFRYILR